MCATLKKSEVVEVHTMYNLLQIDNFFSKYTKSLTTIPKLNCREGSMGLIQSYIVMC